MNKVILIGRLTADPKINEKITCAAFTLAVDRAYKREGGQSADFISCKMLGEKSADFANKYLRKGIKIAVAGRIQTGSYQKQDGTKVYTTDVIVESSEFAESKKAQAENRKSQKEDDDFVSVPDDYEGLPFD